MRWSLFFFAEERNPIQNILAEIRDFFFALVDYGKVKRRADSADK